MHKVRSKISDFSRTLLDTNQFLVCIIFLINYSYATIGGHKNIGKKYAINTCRNSQRKAWNKQTVIFLFDVALFFILLNTLFWICSK